MATKNDITGDSIRSRLPSKSYSAGWDRIFGKKKKKQATKKKEGNLTK